MPNMLSVKRLCLLLTFSFCSTTNTRAEDVTVFSGDAAFLPCPSQFNNGDKVNVKWLKEGNDSILCGGHIQSNAILDHNCRPRFKLNTGPLGLNITDVESSDAGVYNCVMTRLIPPPSVERSLILEFKVFSSAAVLPSLTLQLINNTNSSCVKLICSLQGLSQQQVNFTWTRANQLLHHLETSSMNGSMNSTLMICKPNWTEGETFTCQASYSHNRTLSKDITLTQNSVIIIIIAAVSSCAGLLLLVLLCVAIFKCKKSRDSSGPVIYRNKIYENFTFSSSTINPTTNLQIAQLGARSPIKSKARCVKQKTRQNEKEECVYEN